MIRSNGRKVIGICLMAALSLMAFAASAQAEATSNWKVNGSNVNSTLLPEVQVKELENKTADLLFTTKGGTKVDILCTAVSLSNVKLKTTGSTTEGTATFSGCLTKLNGTTTANCKPKGGGGASGTIITKNGLGLLQLSGGETVTKLFPEVAPEFVNIEMGELCAIGENVPVAGNLNLKDCKGVIGTELVEHLAEQGAGTSLTALGQPATIDGSVILALAGTGHVGLKFSGVAG